MTYNKFLKEYGFYIITTIVLTSVFFGGFFIGKYGRAAASLAQIEQANSTQSKVTINENVYDLNESVYTETKPALKSLGKFTLTAYCSCKKCCGKSDGITATGAKVQQGVTVAVDPKVIPYGTTIIINGNEYIAQDTMSKRIIEKYNGKIIDIYFDSHSDALEFGVQSAEVFVKH